MLTIIESGSQAWALAAADGDLHIYSREEAGAWTEVLLSEEAEQIDQDGSSILEALYEQYAAADQNGETAAPDTEQEEPEDQGEPLEGDEEPEDQGEPLEGDEEPEDEEELPDDEEELPQDEEELPEDEEELPDDEEEQPVDEEDEEVADEEEAKPRRSRARTRAKKK